MREGTVVMNIYIRYKNFVKTPSGCGVTEWPQSTARLCVWHEAIGIAPSSEGNF